MRSPLCFPVDTVLAVFRDASPRMHVVDIGEQASMSVILLVPHRIRLPVALGVTSNLYRLLFAIKRNRASVKHIAVTPCVPLMIDHPRTSCPVRHSIGWMIRLSIAVANVATSASVLVLFWISSNTTPRKWRCATARLRTGTLGTEAEIAWMGLEGGAV